MKDSTKPRRKAVALGATAALTLSMSAGAVLPALADSPSPAAPMQQQTDGIFDRLAGADRYETSYKVALESGGNTVFLASGEVFADALSARTPVNEAAEGLTPQIDGSGSQGVPVLLTPPTSLTPYLEPYAEAQANEQESLNVVIIGGTGAVSADVEDEAVALGYNVERIGGEDRYETAALVAAGFDGPQTDVAFVATGENFPDALSGGALASAVGAPMLLTKADGLSDAAAAEITRLELSEVVVLGGESAVSADVVTELEALGVDVVRVAGADRYETSAAVAEFFPQDVSLAWAASGELFPDALSASGSAGYYGQPVLLTEQAELPQATAAAMDRLSPQGVYVVGGTAAISAGVEEVLRAAYPAWLDSLHAQILSFNDYHGHLEVEEGATLTATQDPEQNLVGGVANLSTTLDALRSNVYADQSLTVAAGDLIGGSPFLSGIFHDEPSVESLNAIGLDVSSVGNHEFDEGTEELLRMQSGGCHPVDGCFGSVDDYEGADFNWLAANVVDKESGETFLPGTEVRSMGGTSGGAVDVGFIGMTLEATPTLVSPAGVSTVDFLDEIETANAQAGVLQDSGVESIVVLMHEGGFVTGGYNGCDGVSGPMVAIAEGLDPAIDLIVTGHTHEPYVCDIPDPAGNDRLVTSANQYGRAVTETDLTISRETGDVVRDQSVAQNRLVLQGNEDPEVAALVADWKSQSEVAGAEVVGSVAEDITGDSGGDRGIETPMANLVADSILYGTSAADAGGAEISFMNVGGVRASLAQGDVTYSEAYDVMPFGNLLVSVDMTGQDIKDVLEQQYTPGRSREYLALGVSEGFSYTWDDTQAQGSKVSGMELNGVALDLGETYRVSTLNFLQGGGDQFTAFTNGTNLLGGPEDLGNLVSYLTANPGLSAPGDRVDGL